MIQCQTIDNWKQFKGEARRQWGKIAHNTLCTMDGSREELSGHIQEAYGVAKEEADRQIQRWEEHCRRRKAA